MKLHHLAIFFLAMFAVACIWIPGFFGTIIHVLDTDYLWLRILLLSLLILGLSMNESIRSTGFYGLLLLLSPIIIWIIWKLGLIELTKRIFNEAGWWLLIPVAIIILYLLSKAKLLSALSIPSKSASERLFVYGLTIASLYIIFFVILPKISGKSLIQTAENALYNYDPNRPSPVASAEPNKLWKGEKYKWVAKPGEDVYFFPKKVGETIVMEVTNVDLGVSWIYKATRHSNGDAGVVTSTSRTPIAYSGDLLIAQRKNSVDVTVERKYY